MGYGQKGHRTRQFEGGAPNPYQGGACAPGAPPPVSPPMIYTTYLAILRVLLHCYCILVHCPIIRETDSCSIEGGAECGVSGGGVGGGPRSDQTTD